MNSFKVIKAYLAKKAQEPIPDSPERRKALDFLQRNSALVSEYFEKGLITKDEALPFALKILKYNPLYVFRYFKEGLITREEALPFALKALKENPDGLSYYFSEGLVTKEEALSFVLDQLEDYPLMLGYYFRVSGVLTEKEARLFALERLEKDYSIVDDYLKEGLITKEDALPFVLEQFTKNPHRLYLYIQGYLPHLEVCTFKNLLEKNVPIKQAGDILIRMHKGTLSAEDKKLILGDINHRDLAADHHFGWMSPDQRGKAMGKLPQPLGRSKVDTRVRRNQDVILPASYRRKSRFGEDRETVKGVNSLNRMLGLPLGHDDLGDIHRALLKFNLEGHIGLQEAKAYSDEILAMAKPEERQEIKEQRLLLNDHIVQ